MRRGGEGGAGGSGSPAGQAAGIGVMGAGGCGGRPAAGTGGAVGPGVIGVAIGAAIGTAAGSAVTISGFEMGLFWSSSSGGVTGDGMSGVTGAAALALGGLLGSAGLLEPPFQPGRGVLGGLGPKTFEDGFGATDLAAQGGGTGTFATLATPPPPSLALATLRCSDFPVARDPVHKTGFHLSCKESMMCCISSSLTVFVISPCQLMC